MVLKPASNILWKNSSDRLVYFTLKRNGPMTRDELVDEIDILPRTTTFDALTRLTTRQLVVRCDELVRRRGRRCIFYSCTDQFSTVSLSKHPPEIEETRQLMHDLLGVSLNIEVSEERMTLSDSDKEEEKEDPAKSPIAELLKEINHEYKRLKSAGMSYVNWRAIPEEKLWLTLVECILNSQVPYQTMLSVIQVLRDPFLQIDFLASNVKAKAILSQELAKEQFQPPKGDGELRKYRFAHRAEFLVHNARVVQKKSLVNFLSENKSAKVARERLCANFKGLGMQQASQFLRAVNFTRNLVIVNKYTLDFLRIVDLLPKELLSDPLLSITPRFYCRLEVIFQDYCRKRDYVPMILDRAIWSVLGKRCYARMSC